MEIIRDVENIIDSNSISLFHSPLTGTQNIVGLGSTTFSFICPVSPEKLEYTSSDGEFSYFTNSTRTDGPISKIVIEDNGFQYRTLPGISTIITNSGKNAVLETRGYDIGKICHTVIRDIGFDYPVDRTLRPEANIPQLIKVDLLTSLDSIGISSVGKNYLESPGLVLLDGLTLSLIHI